MFALLTACLLACTPAVQSVTVAGDSVILTVAIADDLGPQTVSVDSLFVTAGLGLFGSDQSLRLAKSAGVTEARFAFPRSAWAPGATLGSTVRLQLGHVDPGCPNGICWSAETTGPTWSYTDEAVAPNPAPPDAITVESVSLN